LNISELAKEYYKELFLFVVAPTFSWWSGGFNWVSSYLHGNTYEFSRASIIVTFLCCLLLVLISIRKIRVLYNSYKSLQSNNNVVEINRDLQGVLMAIYHTPKGGLQSKSTLFEAGVANDIQTSQYYLEKLEYLDLIESTHYIEEDDEELYELTAKGREFIIENQLQMS
jgi:predicted transcriptional regulator